MDVNGYPLEPGDKIHYIINITNIGDKNHKNNAGNELEDFIPKHTTYEENSLKANKGIADITGNKIIWNGEINVSETITIEFNVTVAQLIDNNTYINNTAKLFWDSNGDNVNENYSYANISLQVICYPLLQITKSDERDPVHPGDWLNYTITVTNTGNGNATNVIIEETYDSRIIYQYANPPPTTGNNIWQFPLIQPGESETIHIYTKVKKPLENVILHNYVNATCGEGKYDETWQNTTVISAPELIITKEAMDVNGYPLEPGDKIHYIINITNIGDKNHKNNAGNELEDFIPKHTTYEENSLKANKGIADITGNKIIWNGEINVSETITIEFNVTVAQLIDNNTYINNTAKLFWDSNGDNVNENYSYANISLQVICYPLLQITKSDERDPVHPGDWLNYTITVTNTGNGNATNVIIEETYDSRIIYQYANPPPTTGNNIWQFPLIQPGESETIHIYTKVKKPLENVILHNYVNATCGEGKYDETWQNTTVISPVLKIYKESIPAVAEKNATILFKIKVENIGLAKATEVFVKDVPDNKVKYNFSTSDGIMVDNYTWYFEEIEPGDEKEILIYVDVLADEGDIIINYANVTCNEESYDEVEIEVLVKSYPPYTYKKFNGAVINETWFYDGLYVLHYILNTTTIDLVAIDNGSGIEKTYYRIFKFVDGRWILLFDWQEYGKWNAYLPYYPINLADLAELYNHSPCGKFEIEFYSVDKAGNIEEMRWNDVFVDCYAPISFINISGETLHSINLTVNASDEGVGIEKIEIYYRYSVDNVSWSNWTLFATIEQNATLKFMLNKTGYYQFTSVAYDLLGNKEYLKVKIIYRYKEPWDVNGDGKVNLDDLIILIEHWLETPSQPDWCKDADVNRDGIVNVYDVLLIMIHWTG